MKREFKKLGNKLYQLEEEKIIVEKLKNNSNEGFLEALKEERIKNRYR